MTLHRLTLAHLDMPSLRLDHNPVILHAQTQLQAVWDGEYDDDDTVTALKNVAMVLNHLADSISDNY